VQFVPRSEISDEDIINGRATPVWITEGLLTIGTLQATGRLMGDILTWNLADFKKHWDDPIMRAQLINGLLDSLGMYIFMGFVKLLFGEDTVKSKNSQN